MHWHQKTSKEQVVVYSDSWRTEVYGVYTLICNTLQPHLLKFKILK